MSNIQINPPGFFKSVGLALIVSSILLAAGNTLLIAIHKLGNTSEAIGPYANGVARYLTLWHLAHIMLILAPILWTFSFISLYRLLAQKGEQIFSLAALITLSIATILQILSAMEGGFVIPLLSERYLYLAFDQSLQGDVVHVLTYSRDLTLTLSALAIFLEVSGTGLFSISLLKSRLYNKWLAWLGVGVGLFGLVGYLTGVFGPYWISGPLFLPLGAISSTWIIWLGIVIFGDMSTTTA
jgi:hypothetical protein